MLFWSNLEHAHSFQWRGTSRGSGCECLELLGFLISYSSQMVASPTILLIQSTPIKNTINNIGNKQITYLECGAEWMYSYGSPMETGGTVGQWS